MATSQKLTDHFLTCTICTEVFKDPCTLECNHTFCRKCVVSFTKTKPEAVAAKSIPCPFCWRWSKVPNPSKPVEQWADDIKPIFLIQGLLDSFGPRSKDTTNCSYCRERGETTPALYWCSVCDDALCDKCILIHRRIPATCNHDVDDLPPEVKVRRRRKVTCKEHTNEFVEFHCKDCKKAICQKCCIIYHRKCESVNTLESELVEMKSVLTRSQEKLLQKEQERRESNEEHKRRLIEAMKDQSNIKSEIESSFERVIEEIKKKKIKLLYEVDEATGKQTRQLKSIIKSGKMAIQMFQQQSQLINQAVKSDCEIDIYEMYKSFESVGDTDMDPKDTEKITKVRLKNNTDEIMKTLNELKLGEIDILHEGELNLTGTPVLQDTIAVRMPGDKRTACPTDVTVLDVNGIDRAVVTDWYNSSVKSFYKRNNQPCHSKLSLDGNPWGLTQLTHNQVAVTVPDTKQIVTVEVKPELNRISTINTQKAYRGITCLTQSTLAVGSDSAPSVDILDMSGKVIRSVTPHSDNTQTITRPYFLSTTKNGDFLISNFGRSTFSCFSPGGNFVFRHTLDNVWGHYAITSTRSGDILASSFGNGEFSVSHLTESGQFIRNTLTLADHQISVIWGLCLDSCDRLYVCLFKKGIIKVYKSTKKGRRRYYVYCLTYIMELYINNTI